MSAEDSYSKNSEEYCEFKNRIGTIANGRTAEQEFLVRYKILRGVKRCTKCNLCSSKCPQHIDVPKNLNDIFELKTGLTSSQNKT
ncbi:hypothetical protein FACS18949_11220 [Clostridia bacterium]|nr:hypothetical protein FACS18949_11220 [Clostridia bacterium]